MCEISAGILIGLLVFYVPSVLWFLWLFADNGPFRKKL